MLVYVGITVDAFMALNSAATIQPFDILAINKTPNNLRRNIF